MASASLLMVRPRGPRTGPISNASLFLSNRSYPVSCFMESFIYGRLTSFIMTILNWIKNQYSLYKSVNSLSTIILCALIINEIQWKFNGRIQWEFINKSAFQRIIKDFKNSVNYCCVQYVTMLSAANHQAYSRLIIRNNSFRILWKFETPPAPCNARTCARGNRSYGLCIAFDLLATMLHRWILWPAKTKKLGRSEVGLAVVIVVVAVAIAVVRRRRFACRVWDLWHLAPAGNRAISHC